MQAINTKIKLKMRHIIPHLILCLLTCGIFSQSIYAQCNEDINLQSQAEVDNFTTDYNCTVINGSLSISGTDITNLDALNGITSISQNLEIRGNDNLTSLAAFSNLNTLGGNLVVGLNESITIIDGFQNITNIGGHLQITTNPSLVSLDGLQNIVSVGRFVDIHQNDALTNLDGFQNLNTVFGQLDVRGNDVLTDINGLASIAHVSAFLRIKNNAMLQECCIIQCWLDAVEGDKYIGNNADVSGCKSLEDIATACTDVVLDCDRSYIVAFCFYDINNNGTYDEAAGEYGLNNQSVSIAPNSLYGFSDNEGYQTFTVQDGIYDLNIGNSTTWGTTGTTTYTVNANNGNSYQRNFALQPTTAYTDIKGDLSSAPNRCDNIVSYWLTYENKGTQINDGRIEFEPNELIEFISATPAPTLIENGKLYWDYEDLLPTHKETIELTFQMPSSDYMGETLYSEGFVQVFDDAGTTIDEYKFTYEPMLKCSYDPNDKAVLPAGVEEKHYTLFGERLTYTVRFENTGNDVAYDVAIKDVLDEDLDWSTLEIVASSHEVRTELTMEDGTIQFYFDDINLVDSGTDPIASQGFVKYMISPKTGLPEQTAIENTAAIYFDGNEPIITNTTLNTLVSELPNNTTATPQLPFNSFDFTLYPNPTESQISINLAESIRDGASIQVYNAYGQLIQAQPFNGTRLTIDLSKEVNGVYFVQLQADEQSVMKKVFLQH